MSESKPYIPHRKKGALGLIRGSWGIRDAHKLIRKNHWYNIGHPVSEHDFYAIIRNVNLLLADEIANGNTVRLPHKMGKLMLRKHEVGVALKDGKLKITYPPNWSETLKLWYEDEEARKAKTLLRHESPYVYYVYYDKWKAEYENKIFYRFMLNTFIKKKLSKNIKSGKVDTVW